MKIRFCTRTLMLCGAAAALLACGKEQAANDSMNAASAGSTTAATANAPMSAAAVAPGAVNADFLVGKWSAFGEDCKNTIEFRRDGTAVTPIGEAKWSLSGDKLQFDYGDGSKQPPSTVKPLGNDRIEFTKESGTKETQKRCG